MRGKARQEPPRPRRSERAAPPDICSIALTTKSPLLANAWATCWPNRLCNWVQVHSLFGQQVAQAFANNGDFVVNAIEQMSGGAALSDLRGRGGSWRAFPRIQRVEGDRHSQ